MEYSRNLRSIWFWKFLAQYIQVYCPKVFQPKQLKKVKCPKKKKEEEEETKYTLAFHAEGKKVSELWLCLVEAILTQRKPCFFHRIQNREKWTPRWCCFGCMAPSIVDKKKKNAIFTVPVATQGVLNFRLIRGRRKVGAVGRL